MREEKSPSKICEFVSSMQKPLQMGELQGRMKQGETRLASERAQHSAAAKDLMLAQEEALELKRRLRVAVRHSVLPCSAQNS